MKIDLVVFDMAGTTVNDRDGVNDCLRESIHAAGLTVTREAVNAVMGIPKPEALRILIHDSPQAAELLPRVMAIHADFVQRMSRFYATDPSVYATPGAEETFRMLRQMGIKVALDTGFYRGIVEVVLQRLGWHEGSVIDASIASDEVPRGRPHPDMIHALMRHFDIHDPGRVAKVGDTPADLLEGTQAGCGLVVGVTQGSHTRAQLEVHPHTHLIATVAEFPALLSS